MQLAGWLFVECSLFVFFFHQLRLIVVEFCFLFCFDPGHCNHFLVARCPWFLLFLTKLFLCFFILFLFAPSRPWSLPVVKTSSEEVLRSRRGSSQSSDGGCSFSLGADRGRPSHQGCSESPEIVQVSEVARSQSSEVALEVALHHWWVGPPVLSRLIVVVFGFDNFLTFCFIF